MISKKDSVIKRPIEFKAWVKNQEGHFFMGDVVNMTSMSEPEFMTVDVVKNKTYFYDISDYVLLQFTELCDKNGEKLFDGDVCQDCRDLMTIYFENGCFYVKYHRANLNPGYLFRVIEEIEKIGNIYENPDLLEEVID